MSHLFIKMKYKFFHSISSGPFVVLLALLPAMVHWGCAARGIGRKALGEASVTAQAGAIIGRTNLAQEIEAILQDSVLAATTPAVKVVRLRDGATLYQKNNGKLFHPASNMKLFTVAAALKTLGSNYRFVTSVLADSGAAIGDTLAGNLYLVGAGDPDFSPGDLSDLIAQIRSRGLRAITGDIVCDDFFLDDTRLGNGWMWDEGASEDFAPIGALSINGNCVTVFARPARQAGEPVHISLLPETAYMHIANTSVTLDSASFYRMQQDDTQQFLPLKIDRNWPAHENIIEVSGGMLAGSDEVRAVLSVEEPALYFGTLFKEFCTRAGISIDGAIRRGPAPAGAMPLAHVVSAPLGTIAANVNKPSDNLSAELLLKVVGAQAKGTPGTAAKGLQAVKEMLAGMGADTTKLWFADGSGVSRYNLLSPDLVINLLAGMYEDFAVRSEFIASLSIAGVDGSLKNRMRGTAAEGKVHAKTGNIRGVTTLSGYTQDGDGDVLAFSIMIAHFAGSSKPFHEIQDRLCDVFTRYHEQSIKMSDGAAASPSP